jgi:thioredoxin reductase
LQDFVDQHAIRVRYGAEIVRISKPSHFELTDANGQVYAGRRLIIATGVSKTYVPNIPGIEAVEDYSTMPIDPDQFEGQRVLILGKGNSAFETADNLVDTAALLHLVSPNPLKMAWKTHYPGHLRAVNNNVVDTYLLKSQNAILDATVERIARSGTQLLVTFRYTHAEGESEVIAYDRVLGCTGFRFDASIFDETCRPQMCSMGKLPAQTAGWRSQNVEDLYFAGTLTQYRDYKTSASPFIHGFRYNTRSLYRMLAQRYEGKPWPVRTAVATPDALTALLIERINRTSGLWQMFGFLCDAVVPSADQQHLQHFEEMPVDFVHESEIGSQDFYFLLTLEYGHNKEFDPFSNERVGRTNVLRSDMSNFLHPVVRCFSHGKLLAEHHVIEDLAAEWREDEHIEPLRAFLHHQFATHVLLRKQGRDEELEPELAD